MVTKHDFSIGEEFAGLDDALKQKAKAFGKSRWICKILSEAIKEEREGQQNTFDGMVEKQQQDESLDKFFLSLQVETLLNYELFAAKYDRSELEKIWRLGDKLKRVANMAQDYHMHLEKSRATKIHGYPSNPVQQHFSLESRPDVSQ